MQSDDLDNRIRGLTERNEPAFEEKSWDKMELLLDKHLPQKKRRRRFLILLLCTLLISIPGYLILQNRFSVTQPTAVQQEAGSAAIHKRKPGSVPVNDDAGRSAPSPDAGDSPPTEKKNMSNAGSTVQKTASEMTNQEPSSQNPSVIAGDSPLRLNKERPSKPENKALVVFRAPFFSRSKETRQNNTGFKNNEKVNARTDGNGTEENGAELKDTATHMQAGTVDSLTNKPTDDTAAAIVQLGTVLPDTKNDSAAVAEEEEPIKPAALKRASKKGNRFAINLSVGPDLSSVGAKNPGKAALQYGLGLGYAINRRWTVRTGFYTVHKKYVAAPGDYHPPAGYWTYYANLQKIDAACKVYEIPLSLVYNFGFHKDHSWFVAGGASSYIMKKEVYYYEYKNQVGQPAYYTRTIDNKNKHIFSVLNLSGGYSYKINKRLSFIAEPYIKIPLTGVGFGKVRLNSAGVLFTLSMRPFAGNK